MAIIKKVRGFEPKIGENCFLADNAVVVGDVTMGNDCSIWFGAVLRGDVNTITIGNRVNIQDNSVIHTLYEKSVTEIGNDVSVGHNVVVHGAKIGDMALIAGSVVLGGTKVGPHELWAGSPAKFKKMVDPKQASEINVKIAKNYLMYSTWYED